MTKILKENINYYSNFSFITIQEFIRLRKINKKGEKKTFIPIRNNFFNKILLLKTKFHNIPSFFK